jgi:hypothetical protein
MMIEYRNKKSERMKAEDIGDGEVILHMGEYLLKTDNRAWNEHSGNFDSMCVSVVSGRIAWVDSDEMVYLVECRFVVYE